MRRDSLKDLKARLAQCNLGNPEVRSLMHIGITGERERLSEDEASLSACLEAAATLVHASGNFEEEDTQVVRGMILRLVDVVAQARERNASAREAEVDGKAASDQGGLDVLNRMALGSVMIELGFVGEAEVDDALSHATRSGRSIGETLVERGSATPEEVAQALALQRVLASHTAEGGAGASRSVVTVQGVLLGEMLVAHGLLGRVDLERGVRHQKRTGTRLGEALVELGYVSEADLRRILEQQAELSDGEQA